MTKESSNEKPVTEVVTGSLIDAEWQDGGAPVDPALPGNRYAPLRFIQYLSNSAAVFAAILLAAATVLILADMLMRNIGGRSIPGVTEMSAWFMAGIGWLALSYTLRKDGHIQITIVTDRLSSRIRNVLAMIISVIGLAFMVVTTFAMVNRFKYFLESGTRGNETGFPMWWIYAIVLLGAVLFTLQFVVRLFDDIYRARKKA